MALRTGNTKTLSVALEGRNNTGRAFSEVQKGLQATERMASRATKSLDSFFNIGKGSRAGGGAIGGAVSGILAGFGSILRLVPRVGGALSGVVGIVSSLTVGLIGLASRGISLAIGAFQTLLSYGMKLVSTITNVVGSIVRFAAELAGRALSAVMSFASAVGGMAVSAVEKLTKGLLALSGIAASVFAYLGFRGLKFNSELQDMSTSFEAIYKSASKAKAVVGFLKQMSFKTPFEMGGLVGAGKTLATLGMGDSITQMERWIKVMGNLAAASGRGTEGLQMVSHAFQKIASNQIGEAFAILGDLGTVTRKSISPYLESVGGGFNKQNTAFVADYENMEEATQKLEEAQVSLDNALTKNDGTRAAEVRINGLNIKLREAQETYKETTRLHNNWLKAGAPDASMAVFQGLEAYQQGFLGDQMTSLGKNLRTQLQNVGENLTNIFSRATGPAFALISGSIEKVNSFLERLGNNSRFLEALAIPFRVAAQMADKLANTLPGIASWLISLADSGKLESFFSTIFETIGRGISLVVKAVSFIIERFEPIKEVGTSVWNVIWDAANAAFQRILALVVWLTANWETLTKFMSDLWSWFVDTAGKLWDWFQAKLADGIEFAIRLFNGLGAVWAMLPQIWETVVNGVIDGIQIIVSEVEKGIHRITNLLLLLQIPAGLGLLGIGGGAAKGGGAGGGGGTGGSFNWGGLPGMDLGTTAATTMPWWGKALKWGKGAMKGTLGTVGAAVGITEGADWLLGTATGQGGKRLGNGGWLPNLSPFRAVGEGFGAVGDWFTAGRRSREADRRLADARAGAGYSGNAAGSASQVLGGTPGGGLASAGMLDDDFYGNSLKGILGGGAAALSIYGLLRGGKALGYLRGRVGRGANAAYQLKKQGYTLTQGGNSVGPLGLFTALMKKQGSRLPSAIGGAADKLKGGWGKYGGRVGGAANWLTKAAVIYGITSSIFQGNAQLGALGDKYGGVAGPGDNQAFKDNLNTDTGKMLSGLSNMAGVSKEGTWRYNQETGEYDFVGPGKSQWNYSKGQWEMGPAAPLGPGETFGYRPGTIYGNFRNAFNDDAAYAATRGGISHTMKSWFQKGLGVDEYGNPRTLTPFPQIGQMPTLGSTFQGVRGMLGNLSSDWQGYTGPVGAMSLESMPQVTQPRVSVDSQITITIVDSAIKDLIRTEARTVVKDEIARNVSNLKYSAN